MKILVVSFLLFLGYKLFINPDKEDLLEHHEDEKEDYTDYEEIE